MTSRVAHLDTLGDSRVFQYAREDTFQRTYGKCHVFTFQYARAMISYPAMCR